MQEADDNMLLNLGQTSMCRTSSVRSRAGHALSKSLEATRYQSQYEDEISELRGQIAALETKNRKYLEIIGLTVSEQQADLKLQVEAARESLSFAKRTKRLAACDDNEGEDI